MAKFGWNDRELFNVNTVGLENLGATPSENPPAGELKLYFKNGDLYKLDSAGTETQIDTTSALVSVSANDTTPGYLEDKIVVSDGVNTTNALELTTLNDGADEDLQIQFDASKITITSSQVSDFNEAAQDAVGGILVDSASIDFTYDDGANTITAAVIPGGVDHGSLSGLADDDHTQYLLLGGRSGGQITNGGTDASDDLELRSTSNATKGAVKIIDGSEFQHSDRHMFQSSVQTTDATETTAASITLTDDRVYNAIVRVVARRSDGGGQERGSWQFQATVYRAGAGAVIEKSVKQEYKASSSASYAADIDVAANDMRVRVTGAALENVEWKCYVDYIESD